MLFLAVMSQWRCQLIKRNRLNSLSIANNAVDLCFTEQGKPIIIGIRLVERVDMRHIQCALIGVLSYADESKRTVADVIEV